MKKQRVKRPVKPKTYNHVRDPNYTIEDAAQEWEEYYEAKDNYYEAKHGEPKSKYQELKD